MMNQTLQARDVDSFHAEVLNSNTRLKEQKSDGFTLHRGLQAGVSLKHDDYGVLPLWRAWLSTKISGLLRGNGIVY